MPNKQTYLMEVVEILEKPYDGIKFPGYDNVCLPFSELERLVKNQRQDWRVALENFKGVYVIVDKLNGKKHVGSAYGDSGIWARWSCYAGTGHGNNDGLVDLLNEMGVDYARENFQMAILELLSMKTDVESVIRRESFWKDLFRREESSGTTRTNKWCGLILCAKV